MRRAPTCTKREPTQDIGEADSRPGFRCQGKRAPCSSGGVETTLMPDHPRLIAENPEAVAWVDQVKSVYSDNQVCGKIGSAVIWADTTGPDGEQLVPIDDPRSLIADINTNGFPLLKGHD